MSKFALLAGLAFCGVATNSFAADLVLGQAPASTPVAETGIYIQLLGGLSATTSLLTFEESGDESVTEYDVPAGFAIAGVVGVATGFGGLSVEADAFFTTRDYLEGDYNLTTASLMADLKYTFALTESLDLYVAAGVGGVYASDVYNDDGEAYLNGWGAGYLLKAGATAEVVDGISLVGELRYTDTFAPIANDIEDNLDEKFGTAAALFGIQFAF